jgi:hypothetical protein
MCKRVPCPVDLDIVVASAKAFVTALNRIGLRKERMDGV